MATPIDRPTDWRARAACRRLDPEAFFPLDPGGPEAAAAREVCSYCPVQAACLADVMASEDPARRWGVVGGTTPDERTRIHLAQRAGGVAA
jgi:hypothetical protein